jgi:hypothetical protein
MGWATFCAIFSEKGTDFMIFFTFSPKIGKTGVFDSKQS